MFAPAGSPDVGYLRNLYRKIKYNRLVEREKNSIPVSRESLYEIRPLYHHRINNTYFDDFNYNASSVLEEAQREVYERAASEAKTRGYERVYDVGCGSGDKLVRYFPDFKTVGFDVPETVAKLRQAYPDHEWRSVELGVDHDFQERPDIVVCADVIEHIPDPDKIVHLLRQLGAKLYFISTPERHSFYGRDHDGPPENQAHCREWSFDEFESYIGKSFRVIEHFISNERDHTQLIICEARD